MKRLILPLLCLFVLASSSFAWMTLPVVGGGGGGSSCPPWYADAGVTFSWDGNHDSGNLVGCQDDGTEVTATNNAMDIGTAYSEAGDPSIGARANALGDYLRWAIGTGEVDMAGAGTLCVRINMAALPSADTVVINAYNSTDAVLIYARTSTNTDLISYYNTTDGPDDYAIGAPAATGWKTIAVSWDKPGDDLSTNPGDNGTWLSGYEDDLNESLGVHTNDPIQIDIGSTSGAPGTNIDFDRVAILNTWKADCSALTGW